MTDQADDIPTVFVTVHFTPDHHVANICPLEFTCKGKRYIDWTLIGATAEDCVIEFDSDSVDFQLLPNVAGLGPLRVLNHCKNQALVKYRIGMHKHLVDPSIDNQPIG